MRGVFGGRFDVDVGILLNRYVKSSAEANARLADLLQYVWIRPSNHERIRSFVCAEFTPDAVPSVQILGVMLTKRIVSISDKT